MKSRDNWRTLWSLGIERKNKSFKVKDSRLNIFFLFYFILFLFLFLFSNLGLEISMTLHMIVTNYHTTRHNVIHPLQVMTI